MNPRRRLTVAGLVVLLVAGLGGGCGSGGGYEASFVFPSAAGLPMGSRVLVSGFRAGEVTRLDVRDRQALVTVSLDGKHAPLRAGTRARIQFAGVLGEKWVDITPGPRSAAALPDGAVVTGNTPWVDVDEVLNALDPETRGALVRLVPGLDGALAGREDDVNATLAAAGPAVDALAEVLAAVGQDGPALRRLLVSVRGLVSTINDNRDGVRTTLAGLETTLDAVAGEREALGRALQALPGTLAEADSALARVPRTAQSAVPLLRELRPAVEALPGVAADLRPLLGDLTPTLRDLRPALSPLVEVLDATPALLDRAHSTLPPTTTALSSLLPALDFLRPYMPEAGALLANLAAVASGYDENGHYVRVGLLHGPGQGYYPAGAPAPSFRYNPHRKPGELEGQPTDAAGSPVE